jgi:hypothetical protein
LRDIYTGQTFTTFEVLETCWNDMQWKQALK